MGFENFGTLSDLTVGGESAAIKLLHSQGNVKVLRPVANALGRSLQANALLRKEEWTQLDREVLMIATKRMSVYNDLRAQGLIKTGGGLGLIVSQYETMSDMDPAVVSMSGTHAGNNDRVDFALNSVPIPIIHKDFSLNIRMLLASRAMSGNGGGPPRFARLARYCTVSHARMPIGSRA